MSLEKIILFRIDEQTFGINVDSVSAIEPVKGILSVPNATGFIDGVVNIRGEIVPIYNLRKKMQLKEGRSEEPQLIVTRNGEQQFAYVVDAVDEIYPVDSTMYKEPPSVIVSESTSYIDCIVKKEQQLIICFNVERMLSDSEKEKMKDVVEDMLQ